MSYLRHFYSRISGTSSKRQGGTKATGIWADVASWDVGVEVEGFYDSKQKITYFDVFLNSGNDINDPLHHAKVRGHHTDRQHILRIFQGGDAEPSYRLVEPVEMDIQRANGGLVELKKGLRGLQAQIEELQGGLNSVE